MPASLLLDHLKRFPISATGGLMLTKCALSSSRSFPPKKLTPRVFDRDLAMYQDTISTFSLAPLNDRFEMLRQLGNIFIIQPEILKSYLTESYLARIENRLLRPFVMQRTDFGEFSRRFWDDILLDEVKPSSSAQTSTASSSAVGGISSGLGGFSFGVNQGQEEQAKLARAGSLGGLMKDLEGFSVEG